ncbi:MAG TPA: hypothetical protein VJN21_10825 [Candidatus Acidoferrales bacterium]|nr:hypothetical protein [Candidatus Acidoferrales bacterium]
MKKAAAIIVAFAFVAFIAVRLYAQQPQSQSKPPAQAQSQSSSMSGMDMSEMQHDSSVHPDAASAATESMSDMRGIAMNPHMYMTPLRPANDSDEIRAGKILDALRPALEKYRDYTTALDDGFKIFLPNVKQPHYHFTNWRNALRAQFVFDPSRPTSLLYKKTEDGYELEGAMYTAPRHYTEDQLNERVPLSVARWHKHVNFCMPRRGTPASQVNWKEFGLAGSIATKKACRAAGGRWYPQVFSWMVHVYPFASDPGEIWAH